MDLSFLCKGVLLGIGISIPIGPISILCIRRTLHHGPIAGFVSGLGSTTTDLLFGTIAAGGLTAISTFLLHYSTPLRILGGSLLFYLGIKTIRSAPTKERIVDDAHNLWGDYLSTFFLTVSNPVTIFYLLTVFAAFGFMNTFTSYTAIIVTIVGLCLGSAAWWFTLAHITYRLRSKLKPSFMTIINQLTGAGMMLFALGMWVSIFR